MGPAVKQRRRPRSSTSLVALLQALQGHKLLFELRNDVLIRGKLASVDDYMNLCIDDALWQPIQGPAVQYPFLYIKGRNLRFVHLPKSLNPAMALDQYKRHLQQQRVLAAKELLAKKHERLAKGQGPAAAAEAAGAEAEDVSGSEDSSGGEARNDAAAAAATAGTVGAEEMANSCN